MTDNTLKQIEEMACLQFLPAQIATIIGIDPEEFGDECELQQSPRYHAYIRGQLKAEAEVRKSIFDMAKHGSTPAQKQMLDIIDRNRRQETDA